jgi:hypothetical protein
MSTKTGNVSPTSGSWAARWKLLGLTSRNGLHGGADQSGPIDGMDADSIGAAATVDVDSAPLCGGLAA